MKTLVFGFLISMLIVMVIILLVTLIDIILSAIRMKRILSEIMTQGAQCIVMDICDTTWVLLQKGDVICTGV